MIFLCAKCKIPITENLIFLSEDPPPTENKSGIEFPPQGRFVIGILIEFDPPRYPLSPDSYVFHPGDFINTQSNGEGGCCGLSGLDGINTFCINGHDIGVEFSDCWHAYYCIQVPPENIVKQEL